MLGDLKEAASKETYSKEAAAKGAGEHDSNDSWSFDDTADLV